MLIGVDLVWKIKGSPILNLEFWDTFLPNVTTASCGVFLILWLERIKGPLIKHKWPFPCILCQPMMCSTK